VQSPTIGHCSGTLQIPLWPVPEFDPPCRTKAGNPCKHSMNNQYELTLAAPDPAAIRVPADHGGGSINGSRNLMM
jgi:hypothetical protein